MYHASPKPTLLLLAGHAYFSKCQNYWTLLIDFNIDYIFQRLDTPFIIDIKITYNTLTPCWII